MDRDDRRDLRNGSAWRVPLGVALFFLAWRLLRTGDTMLQLAGVMLAVTGAMLIGPLFAILIAAPTASLFYPRGRAVRAPQYSGAIGRRMRERYEDALGEYQHIAEEFPQELTPYVGMLEICLNDLRDAERADAITRRALQTLRDATDRAQLVRTHRALRDRMLAEMEEKREATSREGAVVEPERRRRFLLVTLDAAGNWPPEMELIRALRRRGHEVKVLSDARHASQIAATGAQFSPYSGTPLLHGTSRIDETPESEMARVLRDVFFNPTFGNELLAEVERQRPDILLIDQMLLTAAAAAKSTSLATVTLWHTVYGAMVDGPPMSAALLEPLNAFRAGLGLSPVSSQRECAEESDAIIAFTLDTFDTPPRVRPPQLHYVGPVACVRRSLPAYSLPWPAEDARPLILVSYSTSFQNQVSTLQRVADAVATLPVRVLLTLGNAITADELQLPDNLVAQPFIPHAVVLPHANLVVTHAGHGTVMAAVTAGVPLVCTPMGRDQHHVAACVAQRGLGVVASPSDTPEALRRVIGAALNDKALQRRCREFAARVDVEAGLQRAVDVLETLGLSS